VPWVVFAAFFALAVPLGSQVLSIPPGKSKGLSSWTDRQMFPRSRIAYTKWNALARVDVVEGSDGWVGWTINPVWRMRMPPQTHIVLDGDAATPIVHYSDDPADLRFLQYTLSSAAYQAFDPSTVLIIGAGGGVDVLTALHHGATEIDAVELNPVIVDLVTGPYAKVSGNLFARPEVTLHVDEGRSFVRRQTSRYDVIQLSLIDTWAASAFGAYSLSEGYLYTVEAFEDYLEHLSEEGVFTITRWLWDPPRETLKLATVATAALRNRGVANPEAHVVVLGLGDMGSVLVKRTPFTPEDIAALERVASMRAFDILYAPGHDDDGPFARFFGTTDPAAFLAGYPYDITPAVDDSPFFFNFGRWPDANALVFGWREGLMTLSGRLVLLAILAQATLLSLGLLVFPLFWRRTRSSGSKSRESGAGPVLVYFSLIGLCFMLIEVALMQRFTLFVGHPLYAVAFVLAVILGAAGLGSMASRRMLPAPLPVFGCIVALSLLYAFGLPWVFQAALGLSLGGRLAIGTLLLLPLGFLLGFPFPAGLSHLVRRDASPTLGWAWAANGCASVVGPVVAALLAIDLGFASVMAVAAGGYAAAYAIYARTPARA
jgi:predicted membrane-bound spermidine synthase